jgi:putative redox protein
MATAEPEREAERVADATATIGTDRYHVDLQAGQHALAADEPADGGGADTGPSPFGLLLSGLGACTAITLRMYADRKQWPLEGVDVQLVYTVKDRATRWIDRQITVRGPLEDNCLAKSHRRSEVSRTEASRWWRR